MNAILALEVLRRQSRLGKALAIGLCALIIAALAASCIPTGTPGQFNVLQSIALAPGQSPAVGAPVSFVFSGVGHCGLVNIDWGDGRTEQFCGSSGSNCPFDLTGPESQRTVTHTFTGWGGGKTVSASPAGSSCIGQVRVRFNMTPSVKSIAFAQPGKSICQTPVPSLPSLAPGSLVHVSMDTASNARAINFGCFAWGCVYDADGKPGSVADSRFPFPGFREYSLVLSVGGTPFQGGTNTQFTTFAGGTLSFCLNDGDKDVTNNAGGYQIDISVDQLGPTPTPPPTP
jgi:hypothetical protein